MTQATRQNRARDFLLAYFLDLILSAVHSLPGNRSWNLDCSLTPFGISAVTADEHIPEFLELLNFKQYDCGIKH